MVGSCASYVKTSTPGCEAKFNVPGFASDTAGTARAGTPSQVTPDVAKIAAKATAKPKKKADTTSNLQGLLGYLIGSKR
jgi:hypothetical protein